MLPGGGPGARAGNYSFLTGPGGVEVAGLEQADGGKGLGWEPGQPDRREHEDRL